MFFSQHLQCCASPVIEKRVMLHGAFLEKIYHIGHKLPPRFSSGVLKRRAGEFQGQLG